MAEKRVFLPPPGEPIVTVRQTDKPTVQFSAEISPSWYLFFSRRMSQTLTADEIVIGSGGGGGVNPLGSLGTTTTVLHGNASGAPTWAAVNHTTEMTGLQGGTTSEYYHLTSAQHTDLTDGGDSALHYHSTDRDSANFTGTSWTDLTDSGDSTLHYHATDRDSANFTGTSWTDLTDAGDSTLHYHDADRNASVAFAFALSFMRI